MINIPNLLLRIPSTSEHRISTERPSFSIVNCSLLLTWFCIIASFVCAKIYVCSLHMQTTSPTATKCSRSNQEAEGDHGKNWIHFVWPWILKVMFRPLIDLQSQKSQASIVFTFTTSARATDGTEENDPTALTTFCHLRFSLHNFKKYFTFFCSKKHILSSVLSCIITDCRQQVENSLSTENKRSRGTLAHRTSPHTIKQTKTAVATLYSQLCSLLYACVSFASCSV